MQRTTAVLIAILMMTGAGGLYLFSQHSLSPSNSDSPAPPEKTEYAQGMVITHSYRQDYQAWPSEGNPALVVTMWLAREFRASDGSEIAIEDQDFYGNTNQSEMYTSWTFHIATLRITPTEDLVFDIDKIRMVLFIKPDILFGSLIHQVSPSYPTNISAGDEVTITIYIVYPNVISGITLYYDSVEIEYVPDT